MTSNFTHRSHLAESLSYRGISPQNPYWYGNLVHLYLELRLGLELEGADGVQNARRAQKYIREAAEASQVVCDQFAGQVLEIHGRTIHLGLEISDPAAVEHQMKGAAGLLHVLLKWSYRGSCPSWRMAADHGMTLTVQGEGIHQDTSLVSLSPAANLPAKMLGKGEVSLWELGSNLDGCWGTERLDAIAERYQSGASAESARLFAKAAEGRAEIFKPRHQNLCAEGGSGRSPRL